jgi:hypothetical protein
MAHSNRERHRDRDPGRRQFDEDEPATGDRVFRIGERDREDIAESLRAVDEARRLLESQHNAVNRDIVRTLRAAADEIYDVINKLEEIDDEPSA